MADPGGNNYKRARDLVLKYGWNTTCFQIVNPGIEYWFDRDAEAVVGYVSSGGVRVVAGAPVCSVEALPSVVKRFENDAAAAGECVCYFGAEARLDTLLRDDPGHSYVLLGAQPVWDPRGWDKIVAGNASLRAQLNRARNKAVTITEWALERSRNSSELKSCLLDWLSTKGLPALHFVVEPETLDRLENRRVFVAERAGSVVGFLVMSPIPERSGWLTEQFPHRKNAPNGTVELMMDAAFRTLAAEDCKYITLGLSPLSKRARIDPFENPIWLKTLLAWMRKHGQRFYNFDGLDHFKSKLIPDRWEPIFAIANEPQFSGKMMWAIAEAFTENRPYRVFARGLAKAVAAEFHNLKNWFRSPSRPLSKFEKK